jgi:ribonucleotide reductase alpha subunit
MIFIPSQRKFSCIVSNSTPILVARDELNHVATYETYRCIYTINYTFEIELHYNVLYN